MESLYPTQLFGNYTIFFNLSFAFFYSFGFYWIFIDIWKYSKIAIGLGNEHSKKVISLLNLRIYKLISIVNLGTFIFLILLNVLFTFFFEFSFLTGVENSILLEISMFYFFIIWISPCVACLLLLIIYSQIKNFNQTEFLSYIEELPEEIRNHIIQNFKTINQKYYRDINNE